MVGLTDILFSPVNISLTILLIILVLYWLLTIISGIDFDLDFDVEVDVDIDSDIDIDTETSLDSGNVSIEDVSNAEVKHQNIIKNRRKDLKWWQIVLIYFNFVGLPFMFTFTFWIFSWWFLTVFTTNLTNSYNNSLGFIIFFLAIIPSLILTKIGTTPFKSLFKNFSKKGVDSLDLIGRVGILETNIKEERIGKAKIKIESSPIIVYVKSIDGKPIDMDENIIIINQVKGDNLYLVQHYEK